MFLLPLVSAPTVVCLAGAAERRWGARAAGLLAAFPTTLPIGLLAVAAELGDQAGATMALSAASHVGAQVAFAITFALIMRRHGLLAGLGAGALVFAALSCVIGTVPAWVAAAAALPALFFGPRAIPHRVSRPSGRRSHRNTVVAAAAAVALVAGVLATARLAGPAAAGALGAFPALSAVLALVIARETGAPAAAAMLQGVIRGLPAYLAFCLVVSLVAPGFGTPVAVVVAGAVCLATCTLTWTSINTR